MSASIMKADLHRYLFLVLFSFLLLPTNAQAAIPVGQVAVVQGKATSRSADGTTTLLHSTSPIYLKDTIETNTGSRLQIVFADKTILTLGPNSLIVIDQYIYTPQKRTSELLFTTSRGVFRMISGNISRFFPDRVKIKTPAATIGIRGCFLAWSAKEDTSLTLLFLGGLQERQRGIYAENAAGITVLTRAEQGLTILSPEHAPSQPQHFTLEQIHNILRATDLFTLQKKDFPDPALEESMDPAADDPYSDYTYNDDAGADDAGIDTDIDDAAYTDDAGIDTDIDDAADIDTDDDD